MCPSIHEIARKSTRTKIGFLGKRKRHTRYVDFDFAISNNYYIEVFLDK